jgi:ABC-2 type transport system ATP-binding protein
VFGFIGPNGAGKSTTIKLIMGLIKPNYGEIHILGRLAAEPDARFSVGYLPENPAFYDFMTAREYLSFVGELFAMNKEAIITQIQQVLKTVSLEEAADRPLRGFSKGMIQRLGLAQVLLHDPDLYILDEPMSGLDPLGRAMVKDIIKDLRQRGKTIFFSTHIIADVEMVCDRVGVILGGKLQIVDNVSTILESGETGYRIHTTTVHGEARETDISKNELADFILRCKAEKDSVVRVEPRRKDLEAFFLDIVARGADESFKTP